MRTGKIKLLAVIALIILIMCNFTSCEEASIILPLLIPFTGIGVLGIATILLIISLFLTAIVILIISCICNAINSNKRKKLQLAKEEKCRLEEEEKRRLEEEWKKSTKCVICGECSMGKNLCVSCQNRAKKILDQTKIPKMCNDEYEYIFKKYKSLHESVINSANKQDRIYYSTKLVVTATLLEYEYFIENLTKETYAFLEDLREIDYKPNEDFLKKYNLENTSEKNEAESFNTSGKVFKCSDGDFVRSKAEREIDNFFFNNRIWHIYEYKYEHPITKEWAVPDFYLPDYNLFIEYFGLGTPEYKEKREHKIKMYRSDKSIRFEYLTFEDDADLNAKLLEICKKYNIPIK